MEWLLYGGFILLVALFAWCWQPPKPTEPAEPEADDTEFNACYDALEQEHNKQVRAAEQAIARVKNGIPHDPVEL